MLAELGEPMLSSTLLMPGDSEPLGTGWQIKERLDDLVDIVIDGDETGASPTTVIDFSDGYPQVVRHGAGDSAPFD